MQQVIPMLAYEDGLAAINWLQTFYIVNGLLIYCRRYSC